MNQLKPKEKEAVKQFARGCMVSSDTIIEALLAMAALVLHGESVHKQIVLELERRRLFERDLLRQIGEDDE